MGEPGVLNTNPEPAFETVAWASRVTGIPESTFYQLLHREPERFGAEWFGRKVMVRRARIEALIDGR